MSQNQLVGWAVGALLVVIAAVPLVGPRLIGEKGEAPKTTARRPPPNRPMTAISAAANGRSACAPPRASTPTACALPTRRTKWATGSRMAATMARTATRR